MNHYRATSNKLSSKSYVFQNKAKIMRKCAKGDPSTTLMCSKMTI